MGPLTKASKLQHWKKTPPPIFSVEVDDVCNNAVFLNTSCEHCPANLPKIHLGRPAASLSPGAPGHCPAGRQSPARPGALPHRSSQTRKSSALCLSQAPPARPGVETVTGQQHKSPSSNVSYAWDKPSLYPRVAPLSQVWRTHRLAGFHTKTF